MDVYIKSETSEGLDSVWFFQNNPSQSIGTKKPGEALCKNLKIETKIKTYKP